MFSDTYFSVLIKFTMSNTQSGPRKVRQEQTTPGKWHTMGPKWDAAMTLLGGGSDEVLIDANVILGGTSATQSVMAASHGAENDENDVGDCS